MRKRIINLFVALILCLSLPSGFALAEEWTDPDETPQVKAIYYKISTISDLIRINDDLTGYYTLENDLDLSGYGWTPLAFQDDFSGVLDGQGHTICGITASGLSDTGAGLFNYVSGTVKNLHVEVLFDNMGTPSGGIAGYLGNGGVLNACSTSGSISSNQACGGLVGYMYSGATIRNCYSTLNVTNPDANNRPGVGGLVGCTEGNSYIVNSYAVGAVMQKGSSDGVGGLVGCNGSAIYSSFYDIAATKANDQYHGFGVSAADMKKQSTFLGWDFENVWGMDSGVNNGYPYLTYAGDERVVKVNGSGTARDPYRITSEAELTAIARGEYVNNFEAYYKLMNDIKLTTDYWTPIGDWFGNSYENGFRGSFDGDGHTISGLSIAYPGYYNAGLFGRVNGGVIKNLHVDANISDGGDTGIIAGYIYDGAEISGCSVSGSVAGEGDVGGLVGYSYNSCLIRNCYSMATVTNKSGMSDDYGNYNCGGLVGYSDGSNRIYTSYAAGKVVTSATNQVAGGLVGYDNGGLAIFSSFYNITTTKMSNEGYGFGISSADMKRQSTFLAWDFDNIWAIDPDINNGFPYLKLTGAEYEFEPEGSGTSRDPYIIRTELDLAAIAGDKYPNNFHAYYKLGNDVVLTSRYWSPIGGNGWLYFQGTFDGDGYSISGLYNAFPGYYDMGLFGAVDNATIQNLNVSGVIKGFSADGENAGNDYVGILAGAFCSNYGNVNLYECSVSGSVTGSGRVGGFAGYASSPNVYNCFSAAKVTNTNRNGGYCGGLFGYGDYVSAQNCYASGVVSATSPDASIGGLIGECNYSSKKILFCYYDNYDSGNYGDCRDTEDMKKSETYLDWDFDNIWIIRPNVNNGYPYLRVMKSAPQTPTPTPTRAPVTPTVTPIPTEKPAPNPNAPQVVIENQTVLTGSEFSVPVLLKNNPGIIGFDFTVSYDEELLELISVDNGDYALNNAPIQSPYVFNWADGVGDNRTDTLAGTMNFRALNDASGSVVLRVAIRDSENFVNADMQTVAFETTDGVITIADYSPGDVNNDGKVNNRDVILIQRHIAGWSVDFTQSAADVNADEKINNRDVILIQRKIAGWDVTLK